MAKLAKPRTGSDVLRRSLQACRQHFVFAAVFSALINLLYLAPTLYMLQVYDRAIPTAGLGTLGLLSLALVVALATLSGLDWIRSRLLVRVSSRLDKELAVPVLTAVLAGSRIPRQLRVQAVRDMDTFRQAMAGGALLALLDAPWAPIYLIAAFLLHPFLGLISLGAGAILVCLAWWNERETGDALKRASDAAAMTYANQDYASASADVVRALGMGEALVAKHQAERRMMIDLQTRASFSTGRNMGLMKFFRLTLQSLALGLGALLAIKHEISGGAVIAASFLLTRTLAPIEQITSGWKTIVQVRGARARLEELLGSQSDVERTQLPAPRGELRFEQVGVLAPNSTERRLLQDISFRIAPGEIVSVVGPSGAGKSTLMRAAVGAVPLEKGIIRLDGASTEDWAPETLARHIGYLPQDFVLFAGTVKDNISRFRGQLGEPQAQIDEMTVAAAQAAGAHQMILQLPRGYDTPVEFNGSGLSAGQRQRIALARALFGSPCLLVLDEPNANLDTEGEMVLVDALNQARKAGVAVLMVAHHGPALGLSDRVMVVKDGKIQAIGPLDSVIRVGAPPAGSPAQTGAPARRDPPARMSA